MKTKLLMLLLATGMGIASCSSSKETTGSSDSAMTDRTGTETMGTTGDTTSTGGATGTSGATDTSRAGSGTGTGTGSGTGTGDTTRTGGGNR